MLRNLDFIEVFPSKSIKFLKERIRLQCESTKLRVIAPNWAVTRVQRPLHEHFRPLRVRETARSGRRSIMRGPGARWLCQSQVRTKRSWCDAPGFAPRGCAGCFSSHTAGRAHFKGGLRSKPPGTCTHSLGAHARPTWENMAQTGASPWAQRVAS